MSITYDAVKGVLDEIVAFIPNPEEKAKAQLAAQARLIEIQAQLDTAQTQVNAAEATSTSFFVAGWRSFIGWICGFALGYHFIMQPFLAFAFSVCGYSISLPEFDMNSLNTILLGMLGLGTMRSIEKVKGVA